MAVRPPRLQRILEILKCKTHKLYIPIHVALSSPHKQNYSTAWQVDAPEKLPKQALFPFCLDVLVWKEL